MGLIYSINGICQVIYIVPQKSVGHSAVLKQLVFTQLFDRNNELMFWRWHDPLRPLRKFIKQHPKCLGMPRTVEKVLQDATELGMKLPLRWAEVVAIVGDGGSTPGTQVFDAVSLYFRWRDAEWPSHFLKIDGTVSGNAVVIDMRQTIDSPVYLIDHERQNDDPVQIAPSILDWVMRNPSDNPD